MSIKSSGYFFLTNKEEEAMKVLWSSDKTLSATEIAEGIPHRKWPATSIQSILKSLEKKGAIEVAEITKIGKTFGRLFRATLSANDYVGMQFKRYYQNDKSNSFIIVSELLGNNRDEEDMVNILQTLLDKYRKDM